MSLDSAQHWLNKPGSVGLLPTDTLYGLVAVASDTEAVSRLYRLKGRDNKPGTIIAADVEQLVGLGLKKRYLSAVSVYWPAALSVVIPCGPELAYLHLGVSGLAVRIPDDSKLRQLLKKTGPLLTSSANLPGQPPASSVKEARAYFKDSLDFYIDGGDLSKRQASTVIRVVDDMIEVLRPGAFKINDQS